MEATLLPKKQQVLNNDVKPSSSGWNASKIQRPFSCSVCNKVVSRKDALIRHMKFHSAEKAFSCDVCGKPFVQRSDLLRHLGIHSKTPKMYKCEQCSVVFSRKYDYLKHGTTHKSKKQHKCEQCSEVYSRKFDLLKHSKIHSKPKTEYNCDQCSKLFLRKSDFLNHAKTHKTPKQHKCDQCSEEFSRKMDLSKHMKTHKSSKKHKCAGCSEVYNSKSALIRHLRTFHAAKPKRTDSLIKAALYEKVKHFSRQNALGVFTKTKITTNEENEHDFIKFFESIRSDVFNELTYQIEEKKRFKWYAVAQARLTRITEDGVTESATPHFHSKTALQLTDHNLPSTIEEAFSKITRSYEEFTNRGSGWTLERILYLELSIAKY